jgi:hypothetical protein
MNDASQILAFTLGAFAGTLLLAFLISRLGLYIRRSSRFEPSTVASVHLVSVLILSIGACGSQTGTPGSSVLTVFVAQAIVFLIDLLRLPRPEDYSDDVPQALRSLAGPRLVAVIAAMLLGFGLVYALARPASDGDLIAEIERGIETVPGGDVYLAALKRNFPDEYRAMATETAQRTRGHRRTGAGGPGAEVRLGEEMGARINALLDGKSSAMPDAPTAALNAYARAIKDNLLILQKTAPEACASVATGEAGSAPGGNEARIASARMLAARMDLTRAGLDRPTERKGSPPPKAELRQLEAKMRALNPRVAQWAGEPGMLRILGAREGCAAAVLYYSAIADLPAETAATIVAYDLRPATSPASVGTGAR